MDTTAQAQDAAPKWIDAASAAQLLGVSPRSIQRRCSSGTLPARRVNGARGRVWEVQAQAVEAERIKDDSDGDTATATTTATATRATEGKRVAVILPFPRSATATQDDDSDKGDSDRRQSVAVEAERLKAELDASRADAQRERELSTFLKSQLEEANRNAAELRAALRKALEIAPRQLTAGTPPEPRTDATTNHSPTPANGSQKPTGAAQRPLTYGDIADELERTLNR